MSIKEVFAQIDKLIKKIEMDQENAKKRVIHYKKCIVLDV